MKHIDFITHEMGKCSIPEKAASELLEKVFSGFETPNEASKTLDKLAIKATDHHVKKILESLALIAKEIHV